MANQSKAGEICEALDEIWDASKEDIDKAIENTKDCITDLEGHIARQQEQIRLLEIIKGMLFVADDQPADPSNESIQAELMDQLKKAGLVASGPYELATVEEGVATSLTAAEAAAAALAADPSYLDPAADGPIRLPVAQSKRRDEIVEMMRQAGKPLRTVDIAKARDESRECVDNCLRKYELETFKRVEPGV
jgi:hypothetical protein